MATKTKSGVGRLILVVMLIIAAGLVVKNMGRHSVGRAEDVPEKWSEPRRMTKPNTADRPMHRVRFIVEAHPERDFMVTAHAGTGQSWGPGAVEDIGRWSWTAPGGVRTGEFAELEVDEASSRERGSLRCWIEVDGKVYRNSGRDHPYRAISDTSSGSGVCEVTVVVG